MNIRPLESLTKEELIELIRHERESDAADTHEMTPVAHRLIFKLNAGKEWPHFWVDGLPTKEILASIAKDNSARVQYAYPAPVRADHCEDVLHMVHEGFKLVPVEPTPEMTDAAKEAYMPFGDMEFALIAALNASPNHTPNAGKMVWSDRSMKEIKASLDDAKGQEHTLIFSAKEVRGLLNTIVNQNQRIDRFEKKIAGHIAQDRKMAEPVFWYRPYGDGGIFEGPVHHSYMDDELKQSGQWVPLYAGNPAVKDSLTAEPTVEMKKAGCQVPLNKVGRHNACYKAMLAAAPQPGHVPDAGKMVEPSATFGMNLLERIAHHKIQKGDMRFMNGILMTCTDPEIGRWQGSEHEPNDTEMLDWMIRKNAAVEHYPFHPIDDKFLVVNPSDDTLTSASNPREAIAKAMRGEE